MQGAVVPPSGKGHLDSITTRGGDIIHGGVFIFACGPWLPKVFPELLLNRIFPTRQEVLFFGAKAGDVRFQPPAMPTWICEGDEVYGMPDLENRGFKIALDRHGPAFDPDTGQRLVSPEAVSKMRAYLARRFPALRDAPVLETRVCQYENTSNGDFLIDRHPGFDNVSWSGAVPDTALSMDRCWASTSLARCWGTALLNLVSAWPARKPCKSARFIRLETKEEVAHLPHFCFSPRHCIPANLR